MLLVLELWPCIRHGFLKVTQFKRLILIYQTDSVRVLFKLTAHNWLELYKLCYALYLCGGIGQTPCSFEHVSCVRMHTKYSGTCYLSIFSLTLLLASGRHYIGYQSDSVLLSKPLWSHIKLWKWDNRFIYVTCLNCFIFINHRLLWDPPVSCYCPWS